MLISQSAISQTYIVKAKTLNVREETTKGGFKNGFKKVFGTAFIIILLILLGYRKMKGEVSDGRYSKGYKEYEISTKDYIIDGIYALIISSFIALIFGIIAWIKTF